MRRITVLVLSASSILLLLVLVGSVQASAASKAKWTIMVYMTADNDLEPQSFLDLEEMEKVKLPGSVRVVVIIDRSAENYEQRLAGYIDVDAYGDWSDTRIYLVQHHPGPGIGSRLLARLGERDMGDPATLLYFVEYVVRNFPSEHYMLVLWNHGSSLGVDYDYGDRDALTLDELRAVFAKLNGMGIHLDIVGFDACLMSMLETIYSLAGYTDYIVASEEVEPGYGWPYDLVLEKLAENPSMTPRELARVIVASYEAFYQEMGRQATTMAAFSLKGLDREEIVAAIRDLSGYVAKHPEQAQAVRQYINEYGAEANEGGITVDFVQLVRGLAERGYNGKALALVNKLVGARLANYAGQEKQGSNGVAIFYPRKFLGRVYAAQTSFGKETNWLDALRAATNIAPEVTDSPTITGQVATNEANTGGEAGAAGLLSALGNIPVDRVPGDEIVAVLATTITKNGESYEASSLLVMGLRGSKLVKIVDKVIDSADSPEASIMPVITTTYDYDNDGSSELYIAEQLYDENGLPATRILLVEPSTGKIVTGIQIDLFEISGIAIGDINGDGKAELVIAGTKYEEQDGYITDMYGKVYIAAPSLGRVINSISIRSHQEGVYPAISGAALADIDGDGAEDVVISINHYDADFNPVTSMDRVYIVSAKDKPRTLVTLRYSANDVAASDIDKDGKPEIVLALSDCRVGVLKIGQGKAEPYALIEFPEKICSVVGGLETSDIDGDGIEEVIVYLLMLSDEGELEDINIRVFSFAGKPSLEYSVNGLFTSGNARIPLVADLNGDGRKEIAYVAVTAHGIRVEVHNITNYVYTKGDLRGSVVDERKKPVADATVIVAIPRQGKYYVTTTDENGVFGLKGIPAATYEVTVIARNKAQATIDVSIEAGKTKQVTIVLRKSSTQTTTTITQTSTTTHTTTTTTTTTHTTTTQHSTTTSTAHHTSSTTTTQTTSTAKTATTTITQTSTGVKTSKTSATNKKTKTGTKTETTTQQIPFTTPINITQQNTSTTKNTEEKEEAAKQKETSSKAETRPATTEEETSPVKTARQNYYYYSIPAVLIVAAVAYVLASRRSSPPAPPPPPG